VGELSIDNFNDLGQGGGHVKGAGGVERVYRSLEVLLKFDKVL